MKLSARLLVPLALLAVSGLALSFRSLQSGPQQPGAQPDPKGRPEGGRRSGGGDLETIMKGMKQQMKALAAGIEDPEKDETSLAAIAELERLVIEAKKLEPANLTEIAAEKRDQHLADYRVDLARLLAGFTAVEIDVLQGKNADAKALLESSILPMREDGHDKYRPEEGKRRRGAGGPGGPGGPGAPR